MFKFFSCLCCQNVDMNEERHESRLLTKFPSTYHLRTLFDDYAISDSENSANSENGNLDEIDLREDLECIIEGNEDCEDELTGRLTTHGNGSVTERNESVTHVDTERSSIGSSGHNTNRSRNSRKGKRRSHRK